MIETFVTILAWIVFVVSTIWFTVIAIAFMQLTPWEQSRAVIKINLIHFLSYLASIAWIITGWVA